MTGIVLSLALWLASSLVAQQPATRAEKIQQQRETTLKSPLAPNMGLYAGTLENSVTPTRPSNGKLVDALGKAAEPFIHVLQRLGFCALRT